VTFLTPEMHLACPVQPREDLDDSMQPHGMMSLGSEGYANIQPLETRKHVIAREQLIHTPPKPEAESDRFFVTAQYSDILQMWKVWGERQRTLAPPVILMKEGTDNQRLEWPRCHRWICQNVNAFGFVTDQLESLDWGSHSGHDGVTNCVGGGHIARKTGEG